MNDHYKPSVNLRVAFLLFLIVCFLLAGCDPKYGLVESSFDLGEGAAIPKWVELASEPDVDITSVKFTFHTIPFFDDVKIVVGYTKNNISYIKEYSGKSRYHELTKDKPRDHYPRYIVIKVNDIEEVFVHKERGPLLYVAEMENVR